MAMCEGTVKEFAKSEFDVSFTDLGSTQKTPRRLIGLRVLLKCKLIQWHFRVLNYSLFAPIMRESFILLEKISGSPITMIYSNADSGFLAL